MFELLKVQTACMNTVFKEFAHFCKHDLLVTQVCQTGAEFP